LVTYKKGAFFIEEKGIQQNFALIKYDHLFIRIDHNCKGICKKIFKNLNKINYKVCVGNDMISKMIIKDLTEYETINMLTDSFHYYDKHIMKIFDKYDIDFKEIIYNFVGLFSLKSEFKEIIENDRFWKNIHEYRQRWDFMGSILTDLSDIEKRELDKDDWVTKYNINERNNLLNDLLIED